MKDAFPKGPRNANLRTKDRGSCAVPHARKRQSNRHHGNQGPNYAGNTELGGGKRETGNNNLKALAGEREGRRKETNFSSIPETALAPLAEATGVKVPRQRSFSLFGGWVTDPFEIDPTDRTRQRTNTRQCLFHFSSTPLPPHPGSKAPALDVWGPAAGYSHAIIHPHSFNQPSPKARLQGLDPLCYANSSTPSIQPPNRSSTGIC